MPANYSVRRAKRGYPLAYDDLTTTASNEKPQADLSSVLPLSKKGVCSYEWWMSVIKSSEDMRDALCDSDWKPNVAAYRNKQPQKDGEIRVNIDFTNVEQKKAQLFFRTPEVQLTARRPDTQDAVNVFQEVINHKLGIHGVNAKNTVDECLFDGLCASGTWACKVGYVATTDGTIPVPTGQIDPMTLQPATVEMPNVIHEHYFMDRVSPAKLLKPRDFFGNDHDKAAWIGFEFVEDLAIARANWKLPDDFEGGGSDKHRLVRDDESENCEGVVVAKEIWYYAARLDKTVKNPERVRQIIFVEGIEKPVVHRDSPYQKFGPDGKFLEGMKGFPVVVGSLRTVGDTPWVPSDCSISRNQADELSQGRYQMVQQRKKSLPIRWFDQNQVNPDDIDRLKNEKIQGMVPLNGNGNEIIGEVSRAQWPRENFTFNDIITKDIDKFWALGSNQQGVTEQSARTATELSLIQSNINVRLDYERTKVLDWYVCAVEKLATLYQLFADDTDYIEVLGDDGNKRLEQWDRHRIQGEFAFSAKPDSAQRVDALTDRKQVLDFLNMMAKNPSINLPELTRIVIDKFGYDPTRLIKPPDPAQPPIPNVGFAFKGEDFVGPASAIVVEIARQAGYQISEQAIASAAAGQAAVEHAQMMEAQAKTTHGGPADKQGPLNKHQLDEGGSGAPGGGRVSIGAGNRPAQDIANQTAPAGPPGVM